MASAGAITAGKAYVVISAIDRTKHVLGAIARNVNAAAMKMQTAGKTMVLGAGAAALGAALPIRKYARFEDAMLAVRAKMQASETDYQALTRLAQHLGETTSYTAQQVADSMVVMAQMGLKASDVEQATEGILNAARATGTGLAEMTDYVLTSIRAFGGSFEETGHYADVLTAACNNSAVNMEMLGESLTYCAKPAKIAGVNIEQCATLLGFLANQGIRGSQAGTALRRMFTNLAANREKLESVGINPFDEQGRFKNIDETIRQIREYANTLSEADRIKFTKDIFGQYALAPMLALMTDGYDDVAQAIQNCGGQAAETAAMMDSSVGGSFRLIWSAVERAGNAFGQAFSGAINGARNDIIAFTQGVTQWIDAHREMVIWVGIGIAAVAALGAAFVTVGIALKILAIALAGFSVIGTIFSVLTAGATALFGVLLSGPVAGFAAIAASVYVLADLITAVFGTTIPEAVQATCAFIGNAWQATANWFMSTFPTLAQEINSFFIGASNLFNSFGKAATDAWNGVAQAGATLWGSLATDCSSAFSAISSQIVDGDWSGAFETVVMLMRAVWSDFQRFFITAWHNTAMAFSEIWQGLRRGIQSAREVMAKLVGWFMKIGMSKEEKAEFDKALNDVQAADRASMERGFTDSKTKHEKAISDAEKQNTSIRDELAKRTGTIQAEAAAKKEKELADKASSEIVTGNGTNSTLETVRAMGGTVSGPNLTNLSQQITSEMRFTASIIEASQKGTAEAERHFLENNANRRNAIIEMERNKERDQNAAATAKNTERLVELAERAEENEDEAL